MERLQWLAASISRGGAIIGGALLLLASIAICIDITLRYAFSLTLGGADDLSGYALAIASAWGFSAALLSRSHIRIDTVYMRVRSRGGRILLDLLSLAAFTLFASLLAWHGFGVFWQSYISNSHSQSAIEMPLAIPQGLWFAGLAFFFGVALLLIARSILALARRDSEQFFSLIGSKSAVAEAKEEASAVTHAMADEKAR